MPQIVLSVRCGSVSCGCLSPWHHRSECEKCLACLRTRFTGIKYFSSIFFAYFLYLATQDSIELFFAFALYLLWVHWAFAATSAMQEWRKGRRAHQCAAKWSFLAAQLSDCSGARQQLLQINWGILCILMNSPVHALMSWVYSREDSLEKRGKHPLAENNWIHYRP